MHTYIHTYIHTYMHTYVAGLAERAESGNSVRTDMQGHARPCGAGGASGVCTVSFQNFMFVFAA